MTGELAAVIRDLVREVVREELARALAEVRPATDRYLSTGDAAALAAVAVGTIRRWVREGRIPGHRAGRVLRVRARDLEAMLATGTREKPLVAALSPEQRARRDFGLKKG